MFPAIGFTSCSYQRSQGVVQTLIEVIQKIKQETGAAPKRVSSNNRTSMTIEVSSREQADKIKNIKEIDGFPVKYMNMLSTTIVEVVFMCMNSIWRMWKI